MKRIFKVALMTLLILAPLKGEETRRNRHERRTKTGKSAKHQQGTLIDNSQCDGTSSQKKKYSECVAQFESICDSCNYCPDECDYPEDFCREQNCENPPPQPKGPGFSLGEPRYGGSGCPANSVDTYIDGSTLNVQWKSSDFKAMTSDRENWVQKDCSLTLPVHVDEGTQVGIVHVEYDGGVRVPNQNDSYAKLYARLRFTGQESYRIDKTYDTVYDGPLEEEKNVPVRWTKCGEGTSFRINTSIVASKDKNSDPDEVMITVASIDTYNEGGTYKYETTSRPCR